MNHHPGGLVDDQQIGVLIEDVEIERLRLRPAIVDGAFQLVDEPTAPEMQVAVDVDAPRFVEFLLERLERL